MVQLLNDFDSVCLQETWLTKQQEAELKVMRKDVNAIANSSNDDSLHITAGRKKEGVAIHWNNKFDQLILLPPINMSIIGLLVSRYHLIIRT